MDAQGCFVYGECVLLPGYEQPVLSPSFVPTVNFLSPEMERCLFEHGVPIGDIDLMRTGEPVSDASRGTAFACAQEFEEGVSEEPIPPPSVTFFPYTFSDGMTVSHYEAAMAYCYQYGPGSLRGIAGECESTFGIIYTDIPSFPPETSNWVDHTWNFQDGSTNSSILNRTDQEYLNYIAVIEAQCAQISLSQFFWKTGAGNDAPENWQNFGIPECSGATQSPSFYCGDNVCDAQEDSYSCSVDCGSYCGDGACTD